MGALYVGPVLGFAEKGAAPTTGNSRFSLQSLRSLGPSGTYPSVTSFAAQMPRQPFGTRCVVKRRDVTRKRSRNGKNQKTRAKDRTPPQQDFRMTENTTSERIFPVEKSLVSTGELQRTLHSEYALSNPSCRLHSASMRDVYLVIAGGEKYIFYVYLHNHRTREEIQSEWSP